MEYITGKSDQAGRKLGVQNLNDLELLGAGLADSARILPEATPHPWGPAYAFSRHLEVRDASNTTSYAAADALLRTYLIGLFCGVLYPERQRLAKGAGDFRLADALISSEAHLRTSNTPEIVFLLHRKYGVVAVHHPRCIFFPAAAASDWPRGRTSQEEAIAEEVEEALRSKLEFQSHAHSQLGGLLALVNLSPPWKRAVEAIRASLERPGLPPAPGRERIQSIGELALAGDGDALVTWSPALLKSRVAELLNIEVSRAGKVRRDLSGTRLRDPDGLVSESIVGEAFFHDEELGLPLSLVGEDGEGVVHYVHDDALLGEWKFEQLNKDRFVLSRAVGGRAVEIAVSGKIVPLSEVLCGSVLVERKKAPAWPIQAAHAQLVERCALLSLREREVEYEIVLKDGRVTKRSIPIADVGASPLLALWPAFSRPGWKLHRLFFSPGNDVRRGDFDLQVLATGRTVLSEVSRPEGLSRTWQVSSRPSSVEIRHRGDDGMFRGLGIFDLDASADSIAPAPTTRFEVALDFGTANTSLSYKAGAGVPDGTIHSWKGLASWQDVLGDRDEIEKVMLNHAVASVTPKGAVEIPSELVWNGTSLDSSLEKPWNVVIPGAGNTGERLVKEGVLLSGFKWNDTTLWPSTGTVISAGAIERAAELYLAEVLRLFCAEHGTTVGSVNLRVAFPLSFLRGQLDGLLKCLHRATNIVSEETGIPVTTAGFVDESTAALIAGNALNADLHLVMDMGGGTTDFAVTHIIRGTAHGASTEPEGSSVRLAGHDVIEAIAQAVSSEKGFTIADLGCEIEEGARVRRKLKLLREVRARGGEVPDDLAHVAPKARGEADKVLSMAMLALAYYGVVLLASYATRKGVSGQKEVQVHLCGNGWSLIRLHSKRAAGAKSADDHRKIEGAFVAELIKKAWSKVAEGSTLSPKWSVSRVPGKAAVSKAMLGVKVIDPSRHNLFAKEPVGVRLLILGQEEDPLAVTPFLWPKEASPRPEGLWWAPPDISSFLGGEDKVKQLCAGLLVEGDSLYENEDAGAEGMETGKTYLVRGVLRALLERGFADELTGRKHRD